MRKRQALTCHLKLYIPAFEIAAIQAVKIFPDAKTHGCLFHFSQCMLHKVQGLGLMRLYPADQDVQTVCLCCLSINFKMCG